ncbi:hypothetical protein CXB51_004047 [Gossypium anomalum]|uniref:Uncharacterized protein n=1 Tax=Gossypium anomalum TaxID=47600 RepID=A0A8J6DAH9_9ROSI|nr:hypothetical protein CXB51_004047 [Gossypium anomalum]
MGSGHEFNEEGEGSSKHYLTDYEVNLNEIKPLSSHGSSDSYSSSGSGSSLDLFDFLGNNDSNDDHTGKSELKSPKKVRVSFASSTDKQEKQVYVPNRIPSSVFSGKPTTPMDWSTASNESLFSIHVGNGSFSKDQFFMLYKSGELTKLDEQIVAQKNVLPSLKELDDMAAMDENTAKDSGNEATVAKTNEVAEDHSHSEPKMAEAEVQSSVDNSPIVDHSAAVGNLSLKKKPTAEVKNLPMNCMSSLLRTAISAFPLPSLCKLTATDGGRVSSVYADQNIKGSHQQQQPLPQHPLEEEKKEFTEETEAQSPVSPQMVRVEAGFPGFLAADVLEVSTLFFVYEI